MSTAVEQIKEKLDIVEVISAYIKVEKAGINFKAKCPFHNEKSASFFISPTRQGFYCFGCGEKGDIFSFVEKFEGLDFKDALQALADKAGVKLEKFRKEDNIDTDKENEEKEKLFEVLEEATKIFEDNLKNNKKEIDYLRKRGLTEASILKWRLGFAKDEWRNLHDSLIQKGFKKEELLNAGLIKKTQETGGQEKFYDTFRNRIIFPISDNMAKIIAFSGRAMKEDEKTPKYLNSPETKLFYKSEVLYGFHIAKNYIRKLDYTVLVEGQMDLVMSHQSGVLNTVASSGTALTELHLKKLKKLSNRVIIAYDADSSGEKAAKRAAEMAFLLGLETKIASLEEGEDPASTVKKNPEEWKEALKKAEHFIDFTLNKALKEKDERKRAKEILINVLPLVSLIESEIERSQFIKKIANKMRVEEQAVWEDLKKSKKRESKIKEGEEELKKIDRDKEAFTFELEKYMKEGDNTKIEEEAELRGKLQKLKKRLKEMAIVLDDPNISEKQEKEAKDEFIKIQKHIKEIS